MSQLQLQYLFRDRPCPAGMEAADYDLLDIISGGCHLYGQVMWPDGGVCGPRPCVVLFHGFPGSARNDDIAHALCRTGCVVLTPHHRGAWGSQGEYRISSCVEDALAVADHVRSEAFCGKYRTDPGAVFFIGHSMGGNTVLSAARELPWLRGLVLMTPFDPTRYVRDGEPQRLRRLLEQGAVLRSGGIDALFQDIMAHMEMFCYENAFDALKDQNLLCAAGAMDDCAPAELMFAPLWERLLSHESRAVRRFVTYPAGHGLLGVRTGLITDIAQFIADVLDAPDVPEQEIACRKGENCHVRAV